MILKKVKTKGLCFLFFAVIFCINMLSAQDVKVTVNIPPPYPIHLEDYVQFPSRAVVTLMNLSQNTYELKLITSIVGDNGIEANVENAWNPLAPIVLNPMETRVLTNAQLQNHFSNLTENDISASGIDLNQVIRTESLPEGSYTVCIKALSIVGNNQLSDDFGCTRIFLTHYDPPIVLLPVNESTVSPLIPQMVNFTWTPSGIGGATRYRLSMVDMTENGLFNPNDAFGPDIYIQPAFQKENIIATTFPYTVGEPPLKFGHEYAIQLTAYDPMGNLAFKNGGKSPVSAFTYKLNQINIEPDDIELANEPPQQQGGGMNNNDIELNNEPPQVQMMGQICQTPPNIANNVAINGQSTFGVNDELQLGDHQLLLTENIQWNGKTLSGWGKIKNTWFKIPILVEFDDLQVNSDGRVISGSAKARGSNNSPAEWLNDLSQISLGQEQVENLIQKLTQDSDTRIVEWPDTKNIGVGMPVAIEKTIAGNTEMVAVVGMHFGIGGSALNAIARFDIPKQEQQLILGAAGVCFDKDGFTKEAFLFLGENFVIGEGKAVEFELFKGDIENPEEGSYVIMDEKGFVELQIDGKLTLGSDKVTPIDDNIEDVSTPVFLRVTDFGNFIITGIDLPAFEVDGLTDYEFQITELSYDHSEEENPDIDWQKIPGYANTGVLWEGFYMKKFTLKLPEKLHEGSPIEIHNVIFDDQGFSAQMIVDEVFNTSEGKMGDKKWPFSMENLDIIIEKNALTSASFNGQIRVPIQDENKYMAYSAVIDNQGDDLEYLFNISPEEEMEFPAIIAKAHILPDTYIEVKDDGNGFQPSFHLYGDITLNTEIGYDIQVAAFSFKGIDVQNVVVDNTGFHLGDGGSISFASPQKEFAGFHAGLDTFSFEKVNEIMFGFWIELAEESSVVGGDCSFNLKLKWDDSRLVYDGLQVNKISIHGDVSVVKVNGEIAFMYNDETYGNGFQGSLNVFIQLQAEGEGGIGIETNIMFGTKNNFKYFYFDGMVDGLPGIPISSTMRIYGFKGGVYHHMKKEGDTYVPDESIVFGILAGAAIGLDVKETFHAKIVLRADFTSSGLGEIEFDGDAYFMTAYQPGFDAYDPIPAVHLGLFVNYDFINKIFTATIEATVQYPPENSIIEGGGEIEIYADLNKWWIKIGSPSTAPGPAPIDLTVLGFLNLESYFMAGHELGTLPPPPEEVLAILGNAYLENKRNNNSLTGGKGFAFGSKVGFDTGDLEAWIFYANLSLVAGFDMMIYSDAECNNEVAGINGWYANGQAYAYISGKAGLRFKFCKKCKERKIPLAEMSIAALVEMGAPNPFWADGYAAGHANVLGIFKGSFEFHVTYGDVCHFEPEIEVNDPLEGLTFIQDIQPREGSEDASSFNVFGKPEVLLTFSTLPGKTYPLAQETEEGDTYNRYFKFPLKTLVLSVDDPNSDRHGEILAKWNENNHIGEFKRNNDGTSFLYKSDKILPQYTQLKLEISVSIMEKDGNVWVEEDTADDDATHKTIWFTTGAEPKTITDDNVDFCFPGRFQRYYLQQDGNYVGYIKTKVEYEEMFDLDYDNELLGTDKILVKFIPLGGGDVIDGEFIKYENQRVFFRHPSLQNNKMYAFQLILEQPPSQWEQNAPDPNEGEYEVDWNLVEADIYAVMTTKQKLLGDLKLEARQRELYKYVFKTSQFDRLGTKITTVSSAELNKPPTPVASGTVEFNIQEPFDQYDTQHLVTFDWNPEHGTAHWFNNYLQPHVYQDYDDLHDIAYGNETQYPVEPTVYMDLVNAVPKLTQAEVDAKLAAEIIPNIGQDINNNMLINLNNGVGNNPPVLNTPKHALRYYGESVGHYVYKNLFMPKLYNFENPVILDCVLNWNTCQSDLKTMMNYHTLNDKEYKRIDPGLYQTLVGYRANVVNAWNTNSKYGLKWNVPFGEGN